MGRQGKNSILKALGVYSALVIASLLTLSLIMQIWRADIHVPFQYGMDSIMCAEWVKSIIDNGWFLDNGYIGMPSGKNLRDVPMSDNFHYAIIKIITLFTGDFAAVMNLFYILTFPLIVCTSYYVFRKFSISPYLSFIGAFLFAFMEYHYLRNIGHIFLSAYYMNPLIIMVVLRLFSGELDALRVRSDGGPGSGSINPKLAGGVVIGLLVSACGIYYAYFSCFFLLVAGAVRSCWQKKLTPAVSAAILIGAITLGGVLNLSPVILYQLQEGRNPSASARVYHEAELYSLKITELLLPVTDHRIKALSDLKNQHDRETSFLYRFYEPKYGASLGIIGGAGFIFLLIFLIIRRKSGNTFGTDRHTLLLHLGILNITALLLATVGGFGSLVAHVIRYKIRAYERLSIFIAFFAVFAVLIMAQFFYDTYIKDRKSPAFRLKGAVVPLPLIAFHTAMFLLLAGGLFDQAGLFSTPQYDSVKKEYAGDKKFVSRIERIMPRGAMVFQLPYVPYPESHHPHKMKDYDHFRCYMHTVNLRWSFGAVKGRAGDIWQRETASKPAAGMIKEIYGKGFRGIFINRNGYRDNGETIVRDIKNILRAEPIASDDGTMVFFSMAR